MPQSSSESCWTRDHLLRNCEGYRVISTGGPLGYVESVLVSETGEAEALAVRIGEDFSQVVPIDFEDVDEIVPEAEIVIVHTLLDREGSARQLPIPALA